MPLRAAGSKGDGRHSDNRTISAAALCEDFAPRNESVSLCGRRGAKAAAGEPAIKRFPSPPSVNFLLPETKPYAFAGGGEQSPRPLNRCPGLHPGHEQMKRDARKNLSDFRASLLIIVIPKGKN